MMALTIRSMTFFADSSLTSTPSITLRFKAIWMGLLLSGIT